MKLLVLGAVTVLAAVVWMIAVGICASMYQERGRRWP